MRSKVWIGVGLAVAAGSAADAAMPPAAMSARTGVVSGAKLWPIADTQGPAAKPAGQGGEGGEAGAARAAEPAAVEAAFVSTLYEIQALLLLSNELVLAGDGKAAAGSLQHVIDELLPKIAAGLAKRQIASFEPDLTTLVASVPALSPGIVGRITAQEDRVALMAKAGTPGAMPSPARAAAVIASLVKHAAVEYSEAVSDGGIKQVPEYRYAYSFVSMAQLKLASADHDLASSDAKAAKAIADDLAKLKSYLASLTPPASALATPAEFTALASRIELKASRFLP